MKSKTNRRASYWAWRWLAAACLVIAASGCTHVSSGAKITKESVAFIEPGITTRGEVTENLGAPTLELEEPHILAYAWQTDFGPSGPPGWQDRRPGDSLEPGHGPGPTRSGIGPSGDPEGPSVGATQRAYCVLLNKEGKVVRTGIIRLKSTSLEEAVREWARGN